MRVENKRHTNAHQPLTSPSATEVSTPLVHHLFKVHECRQFNSHENEGSPEVGLSIVGL